MVPPISGSGAWSAAGRPLPCCSEVLTAPRTPAHRRMSPGKECVVIPRAEASTPARDAVSGPSPDRHGGHVSTRAATAAPPRPGGPRGGLSISGSLTLTPMAKAIPASPDSGGTWLGQAMHPGPWSAPTPWRRSRRPRRPGPGARADLPPDCTSGIGDATRRSGRHGGGIRPRGDAACPGGVRSGRARTSELRARRAPHQTGCCRVSGGLTMSDETSAATPETAGHPSSRSRPGYSLSLSGTPIIGCRGSVPMGWRTREGKARRPIGGRPRRAFAEHENLGSS